MKWINTTLATSALLVGLATQGAFVASASANTVYTGASASISNAVYAPGVRTSDGLLQDAQYRGRARGRYNPDAFRHRSYYDRRYGRGYFGRRYGRYRRDDGAAIAAGFLGFVLGAAIAGSANERNYARSHLNDRTWIASCERRYRSFDPRSGTYLGYDGYRHYCL